MSRKKRSKKTVNAPVTHRIADSAQQVWLAGLGALAKAQEEGGRAFESLVEAGEELETRTREFAQHAADEVREKTHAAGESAQENVDRFEQALDKKLAKSLDKFSVPSKDEFDALTQRLDELAKSVESLAKPKKVKSVSKPKSSGKSHKNSD